MCKGQDIIKIHYFSNDFYSCRSALTFLTKALLTPPVSAGNKFIMMLMK